MILISRAGPPAGSFAQHAPAGIRLVLKHHPMDRPYSDYTKSIERLCKAKGLEGRVDYVHDLHLPTLLKHALGVVTVNSTTGLQALYHDTPVHTLGNSIYSLPGLVHQGALDGFWSRPEPVNRKLFWSFRAHVIRLTQINASFYGATPGLHAALPVGAAAPAEQGVRAFEPAAPAPLFERRRRAWGRAVARRPSSLPMQPLDAPGAPMRADEPKRA